MATIVTRSGKGSALTFVEADANFTNLNTDKIELTDITVGTEQTATGDGAIAYNSTTGVFTYTPPTAAGIGALVAADATLAGDLDVNDNFITNGVTNGNVTVQTNGTGKLVVDTDLLIKDGFFITSETNSDITISSVGTGVVVIDGDLKTNGIITTDTDITLELAPGGTGVITAMAPLILESSITEYITADDVTTGTWEPDATMGTIQVIAMTGSMTITGFANPTAGTSISILFDGTGGSYTLTLSTATFMAPGGTIALTDGGYDVVTITCLDPDIGLYTAFIANDLQPA